MGSSWLLDKLVEVMNNKCDIRPRQSMVEKVTNEATVLRMTRSRKSFSIRESKLKLRIHGQYNRFGVQKNLCLLGVEGCNDVGIKWCLWMIWQSTSPESISTCLSLLTAPNCWVFSQVHECLSNNSQWVWGRSTKKKISEYKIL